MYDLKVILNALYKYFFYKLLIGSDINPLTPGKWLEIVSRRLLTTILTTMNS